VVAVIIAALVISASVTLTLFDRQAYARMEDRVDLADTIGISEEEILANYGALIDYNSIFFSGPLVFPTFGMSETGRIHFEEVKAIFLSFQITLIVSAVLTVFCCIVLFRKHRFRFLILGGILSLAIPAAIVCVMTIIGWDEFFVAFHQVFFNNDFWVFDYREDPVILILPDAWFLDCLIHIVAGIVVSSALLIAGPLTLEKISKNIKNKTLNS
jgi:integral membrane protein (TIGR01906 family)